MSYYDEKIKLFLKVKEIIYIITGLINMIICQLLQLEIAITDI